MAEDRTSPLAQLWDTMMDKSLTSDAIYRTLREAILDGILLPGKRLSENDLATELSVSRTPIREALLRLESERLVWRPSGRGAVVSRLTDEEILDIYAVRATLDGLAAELAATHAIPPQVANLRWINSQLEEAIKAGDVGRMARVGLQFHAALVETSANGVLSYLMSHVHARVRRFPSSTFAYRTYAREVLSEHAEIIDAIEAKLPDVARRLARAHMNRAREIRLKMVTPD